MSFELLEQEELSRIRQLFPVTRKHAYFINAAISPRPLPVVEAIQRFLMSEAQEGCLDFDRWFQVMERCKGRLADLIGSRSEDIAYSKNTSDGLLTLADSLPWSPGDNVVLNDMEFPANVHPWQLMGERDGVELRFASSSEGRVTPEALAEQMDSRTRAVSISWVQYSSGFRCDLEAISQLCDGAGCWLIIDAVQGVGALKLDLKKLARRTMVAGGCHKWLLCPTGVGYLHCPSELLHELRPTRWGWLSMTDPLRMSHHLRLRPETGRFEEGNPNIAAIHGLDAALDLIFEVGPERIESHVLGLGDRVMTGLEQRGYQVASPRGAAERSGIVLLRHETHDARTLCRALRRRDIVAIERDGGVRVSPHFYNSPGEVDRLLETLP